MRFSLKDIERRLVLYAAERQLKRQPDEAERVQAGHWINWPLFVSQPVMPIFVYYFPSLLPITSFFVAVIAFNIIWIRFVSQIFASPALSRLGEFSVPTKWIICPAMAVLLFRAGHLYVGILALSWPILLFPLLFALHRFWPPQALQKTQERFRLAADRSTGR